MILYWWVKKLIYKSDIIVKMKENISLTNIEEPFKAILLSYIDEKKDFTMAFGELCIFHYQVFLGENENYEEILSIAAAVELLVLSFDIIDDLQDGDANYIWCNEPAIAMNAALVMIFLITKLINESTFQHKLQTLQLLNNFALKSINGQYLDLSNCCRDEASYLQMIKDKSGALTALSSLIGVSLATGRVDECVKEYATYIGVIQQIINDIEDLKSWGKKNDLLNRKFSLPIIYLFQQSETYTDTLEKYYNDPTMYIDTVYFDTVVKESGAINYALAIKNIYKYKALNIIETLSIGKENQQYLKSLLE